MLAIESASIGDKTLFYQIKDSKLYFRVYRYSYIPVGKGEDDIIIHCVTLEDAIKELNKVYTLLSKPVWLEGSENRGSSGSLFVVDIDDSKAGLFSPKDLEERANNIYNSIPDSQKEFLEGNTALERVLYYMEKYVID